MMICGVLLFRRRVSRTRLMRVLSERFLRFERFRERPVERDGGDYWETPEASASSDHVVRDTLPGSGDAPRCRHSSPTSLRRRCRRSGRAGSSISSSASTAAARSSCASITATPTASRSSA
jgi:hypothetical protein